MPSSRGIFDGGGRESLRQEVRRGVDDDGGLVFFSQHGRVRGWIFAWQNQHAESPWA
jgi:hypothetical protein